jgi:putative hydrolase of the HAD superfamily
MIEEEAYLKIIKNLSVPMTPLPTGQKKRGAVKKGLRCIIFDVYGTLFVSGAGDISLQRIHHGTSVSADELSISEREAQNKTLKEVLTRNEIELEVEAVHDSLLHGIEEAHARMKKSGIDYPEIVIEEIWMRVLKVKSRERARKCALIYEAVVNPVWPMPSVGEVLDFLIQSGISLGIISNAQFFTPLIFQAFLGRVPEELGFDKDLIIYSYEYGHAKPSQVLFESARAVLEKRSVAAESALYVGNDMLNDILPAHEAGFRTALFAGDKRSLRMRDDDPRCENLTPDIVVTDLWELTEFIIGN